MDANQKLLRKKLTEVLYLVGASSAEIKAANAYKQVDTEYFNYIDEVIGRHNGYCLELTAIHSWRDTLDDKGVFADIDAWIKWKKKR